MARDTAFKSLGKELQREIFLFIILLYWTILYSQLHACVSYWGGVGWLTVQIPNDDLGGGIDQVDELWVGITRRNADGKALKLVLEGVVRQNEDGDTWCVIEWPEKEVVLVDTVKVNVTVDVSTDCQVRKKAVYVCDWVDQNFFNPCTQNQCVHAYPYLPPSLFQQELVKEGRGLIFGTIKYYSESAHCMYNDYVTCMLTISCSRKDIEVQVDCSLYASRMTGADSNSALLINIVDAVVNGHFNFCKVCVCVCVRVNLCI